MVEFAAIIFLLRPTVRRDSCAGCNLRNTSLRRKFVADTDNDASICSPEGRHNLALDVGVEISDDLAYFRNSVEDRFIVVALRKVVALAAALSAAENLFQQRPVQYGIKRGGNQKPHGKGSGRRY